MTKDPVVIKDPEEVTKDPAVLFFIKEWLVATKEMKADCRGWYLNLILHQFDKKDLPNDIEELANLADVRFSEYARFEQVFKDELQHKFKVNSNGRLENGKAKQILKGREIFKEKREAAGKMSYFIRYIRKYLCQDENVLFYIKQNVDLTDVDIKNVHVIEQVFKQTVELYINTNVNVNIHKGEEVKGGAGENEEGENGSPVTEPITGPKGPAIASALIVPELKGVWMKHRKTYQFDMMKDAPQLRMIGEAIAKGEGVSAYEVAGIDCIKQTFEALVVFSLTHSLFKNFQLSQFEKYFQSICEAFRNQGTVPANHGNKTSTVANNFQTAKGAADIIKTKYSNQGVQQQ